jgi:hypothetical protein
MYRGKARLNHLLSPRMKKTFLGLYVRLTEAQTKPNYKQDLRPSIMEEAISNWDDSKGRGLTVSWVFEAFNRAGVFNMSDGVATLAPTLQSVEGEVAPEADEGAGCKRNSPWANACIGSAQGACFGSKEVFVLATYGL